MPEHPQREPHRALRTRLVGRRAQQRAADAQPPEPVVHDEPLYLPHMGVARQPGWRHEPDVPGELLPTSATSNCSGRCRSSKNGPYGGSGRGMTACKGDQLRRSSSPSGSSSASAAGRMKGCVIGPLWHAFHTLLP
ncbi:hypothetical protein GCM10020000_58600 [Streptomyces olivoverticillatus]